MDVSPPAGPRDDRFCVCVLSIHGPLVPTLREERPLPAPGCSCPPWPRAAREGAPRSTLSERARPRLPQACQWRDVFRVASCCACKTRERSFSLPLSAPPEPPPQREGARRCRSPSPSQSWKLGSGSPPWREAPPPDPPEGVPRNRSRPPVHAPRVHRSWNKDTCTFTFSVAAILLSYNLKLVSAFALC